MNKFLEAVVRIVWSVLKTIAALVGFAMILGSFIIIMVALGGAA